MTAYHIVYEIRGKASGTHEISIDANSLKQARQKIGKKHGYKTGRMIHIIAVSIIGYY